MSETINLKEVFLELKKISDNNLLVIDFSHFSPKENKKFDIYLNFYSDNENVKIRYFNFINSLVSNKNSQWKKFSSDENHNFFCEEYSSNIEVKDHTPQEVKEYFEITQDDLICYSDFNPQEDLIKSAPKLLSDNTDYTIVIMHAEHNDAQSIVYAYLKGNCKNFIKSKFKRILNKLLYDEMINSLLEEKNWLSGEYHNSLLQASNSQIFARNFAHNIGSHVAIRATNRAIKERLKNLYSSEIKQEFVTEWLDEASERLDLYEVQRNEFLADVNLPAKNMMLYREVILPFCENTLILDNIAHSENIQYRDGGSQNKLKIKTFINNVELIAKYENLTDKDGNEGISYPENFPYLLKAKDGNPDLVSGLVNKKIFGKKKNPTTEKLEEVDEDYDLEISLGSEHALYSILENFIRNGAKHNIKNEVSKDKIEKDGLEIILKIDDIENDDNFFTITITDNVSKVNWDKLIYFQESIENTLKYKNGTIEKKNLGIADMMINAFLLNTNDPITEDGLRNVLKLVYSTNGKDYKEFDSKNDKPIDEEEFSFGYKFKLCKTKKVLWIGNEDNNKIELRKKGIILQKERKYESNSEDLLPISKYQFAIIEPESVKDLKNDSPNYDWDDYLITLPHRVLLNITKEELNNSDYKELKILVEDGRLQCVKEKVKVPDIGKINWDFEFLKLCWENWLLKWEISQEKKGRLIINLEDKEQAEKWKNNLPETNNNDFVDFNFLYQEDNSYTKSINQISKIDDDDKFVIFDRHANAIASLYNNEKINKNHNLFIDKRVYINFDKSSSDFVNLYYPQSNSNENYLFLLNAIEAGLSRVAILDERITEKLKFTNDDVKNIKKEAGFNSFERIEGSSGNYADLANNSNTFIFSHFQDDVISTIFEHEKHENINFKVKYYNTEFNFKRKIELNTPLKFDSLIIHRTYLFSILENKKFEEQKLILHNLYNKYNRIIVISGGGYPHSLKFSVLFKSFSLLEECFKKYPNKISLLNLL